MENKSEVENNIPLSLEMQAKLKEIECLCTQTKSNIESLKKFGIEIEYTLKTTKLFEDIFSDFSRNLKLSF